MNKKITLFIGSLNAFSLIDYFLKNNLLACIVVADKKNVDTYELVKTLQHYKIPFFIYNQKDSMNIDNLNKIDSDFAFVFGFSFKISQDIIDYFKGDIFNIHASPLPKYRGINPLFWQLKNGEKNTALTIHKLTTNFDEGKIVFTKGFEIDSQDTFGILNGIVSQFVIGLVEEFLTLFNKNKLNASAQIGNISYAREVGQKDIIIDWKTMKSSDIYNLCRASNPIFGGAKSMWNNSMISLLEVTIVDMDNLGLEAGTIIHIGSPEGFIVSTINGCIRIDIVSVPDGFFSGLRFAKRFKIDAGDKFSSIKL